MAERFDTNYLTRLKKERQRRGWTQTVLAYKAGMTPAEISRYETGRMLPYREHARRLAKVLGLKPEQLLD